MPSPVPMILASGSPRRRELLAALGVSVRSGHQPRRRIGRVRLPAPSGWLSITRAIRRKRREEKSGRIDGSWARTPWSRWMDGSSASPLPSTQARDFLRALSGRTHEVITACALVAPDEKSALDRETFFACTRVTFRELSDEDHRPLSRRSPRPRQGGRLRAAGTGRVDHRGAWRARATNVIGLPTEVLERVLLRRGLRLRAPSAHFPWATFLLLLLPGPHRLPPAPRLAHLLRRHGQRAEDGPGAGPLEPHQPFRSRRS